MAEARTKVTDPELLKQLNAAPATGGASASRRRKVTDPETLLLLNGGPEGGEPPTGKALSFAPNLTGVPMFGPVLGAMGMDGRATIEDVQPGARARYDAALAKVRAEQFPDMDDQQWAEYSARAFGPYDKTQLSQHGALFGLTDEMGAGIGALGAGARNLVTGEGPGMGESYGQYEELEQARRDLGREEQGLVGTLAEGVGAVASGGTAIKGALTGGNALVRTAKGVGGSMAAGGAYGAGATDGDLQERTIGAGVGAFSGAVGYGAGALAAKTGRGVVNALTARSARKQAVAAAPMAQDIKRASQAAYDAAEATGAVISPKATPTIHNSLRQLMDAEGLILPNGKMSGNFKVAKRAMKELETYAGKPMTLKQFQRFEETLQDVASSKKAGEGRIGKLMLNQLDEFFDNLPQSGFQQGDGRAAAQDWFKGKELWARYKSTKTIERIIEKAEMAKGGFAEGLRSGFKSLLLDERKSRGFSPDQLAEIRKFVDGGPADGFLNWARSGRGFMGAALGQISGGPVAAVAVPAAGAAAGAALNRGARSTGNMLRASVASGGQLPAANALAGTGGAGANILTRAVPAVERPWLEGKRKLMTRSLRNFLAAADGSATALSGIPAP